MLRHALATAARRTSTTQCFHQRRAFAGVSAEVIKKKLQAALGADAEIVVEDTSSGCGDFFRVFAASSRFDGIGMVAQHRLVQDVLQDEFKSAHGMTIRTKPLKQFRAGNP